MSSPASLPPLSGITRKVNLGVCVVIVHIAALWALQSGLLRRAVELMVPADIMVELLEPAALKAVPRRPTPAAPAPPSIAKAPAPIATVSPQAPAIAATTPAPSPSVVATEPAPVARAPAAAPAAETAPAPVRVELPSSDADYLQNLRPSYPALSKRLGEQGQVVVRVLIGIDGSAQKAEIRQSSGFDRLDQSALNTVLRWRYVPGKRAGIAEAMWFNIPINFVLE